MYPALKSVAPSVNQVNKIPSDVRGILAFLLHIELSSNSVYLDIVLEADLYCLVLVVTIVFS